MRCIAKQCRDWFVESEYLAPHVYVYGGLSLCRVHQEIAVSEETRCNSPDRKLYHRTLLFAIDNATAGK